MKIFKLILLFLLIIINNNLCKFIKLPYLLNYEKLNYSLNIINRKLNRYKRSSILTNNPKPIHMGLRIYNKNFHIIFNKNIKNSIINNNLKIYLNNVLYDNIHNNPIILKGYLNSNRKNSYVFGLFFKNKFFCEIIFNKRNILIIDNGLTYFNKSILEQQGFHSVVYSTDQLNLTGIR